MLVVILLTGLIDFAIFYDGVAIFSQELLTPRGIFAFVLWFLGIIVTILGIIVTIIYSRRSNKELSETFYYVIDRVIHSFWRERLLDHAKGSEGNLSLIESSISRVDEDFTLLHWAVLVGKLENIRSFVTFDDKVNSQDKNGWTPMHWAVFIDDETSIEILEKAGADLTVRTNSGETALDLAYAGKKRKAIACIEGILKRRLLEE